jgi:hypothetical protein
MSEQREVRQMIMVTRHRRELTLGAPRSMTLARRSISYVSPAFQGTSVSTGGFDWCERGRKVYREGEGVASQGHLRDLPWNAELPATAAAPTTSVQTSSVSTTGRIAGLSAPSAATLPINVPVPTNLSVPSSVSRRTTKGPLSGIPAWSPPVL